MTKLFKGPLWKSRLTSCVSKFTYIYLPKKIIIIIKSHKNSVRNYNPLNWNTVYNRFCPNICFFGAGLPKPSRSICFWQNFREQTVLLSSECKHSVLLVIFIWLVSDMNSSNICYRIMAHCDIPFVGLIHGPGYNGVSVEIAVGKPHNVISTSMGGWTSTSPISALEKNGMLRRSGPYPLGRCDVLVVHPWNSLVAHTHITCDRVDTPQSNAS